jgi:hypothetical protein
MNAKYSGKKIYMQVLIIVLISCLTFIVLAEEKKRKINPEDFNYEKVVIEDSESRIEDKKINDIYARLIRYQIAAQDYLNHENKIKPNRKNYLIISILDLKNITQDEFEKVKDNMRASQKNICLELDRQEVCANGDDICLLMYRAGWKNQQTKNNDNINFGASDGSSKYMEYSVKAELNDKAISYKAYAVYPEGDSDSYPILIDPIIPQINSVAKDMLPPVKTPLDEYISGSHYSKMQNDIKGKLKDNKPLIPNDAPIGYLPGDDIK